MNTIVSFASRWAIWRPRDPYGRGRLPGYLQVPPAGHRVCWRRGGGDPVDRSGDSCGSPHGGAGAPRRGRAGHRGAHRSENWFSRQRWRGARVGDSEGPPRRLRHHVCGPRRARAQGGAGNLAGVCGHLVTAVIDHQNIGLCESCRSRHRPERVRFPPPPRAVDSIRDRCWRWRVPRTAPESRAPRDGVRDPDPVRLRANPQRQILWPIVMFNTVEMMNGLVGEQMPPQHLLHQGCARRHRTLPGARVVRRHTFNASVVEAFCDVVMEGTVSSVGMNSVHGD
jgi:hypothetical protein